MAFNPFSWFRKHQRKLIGVVTIFIMFLFILSFGRGDFFDWLGQRMGHDRSQTVATINGKKVSYLDQQKAADLRKMASDFLLLEAVGLSKGFAQDNHSKVLGELMQKELKGAAKTGEFTPTEDLRLVAGHIQERQFKLMRLNPFLVGRDLQSIRDDLRTLNTLGASKEFAKDEDRLKLLDRLATLIGFQSYQFEKAQLQFELARRGITGQPLDDLYFGGNSKRVEDTLDFIMWRNQAERLGIQLTDADLAREINREAAGAEVFSNPEKVNLDTDPTIQKFLGRTQSNAQVTTKEFVQALKDEFRVAMAQGILLGLEPGVRSYRASLGASATPAAAVTPDEFYNYYREQRTTLKAQFLAVPAEKFLDKVKEKPTESELRARYDKFRDREADPSSRDPGFKEPRRILVQYLTADAGDKVYQEAASKVIENWTGPAGAKGRAERVFGAAAGVPANLLGAGPFAAAASLGAAAAFDPLAAEYDRYLSSQAPWATWGVETELSDTQQRGRYRHSSVYSPQALASAVGGGGGGLWAGLGGLASGAMGVETRDAVRQTGGLLLGAADIQNLYGAAALALAAQPAALPYEQVEPMFRAALRERVARDLMRSQLETVSRELTKLKKQPKEAEEYLQKALKEYPALKLHAMPQAKSLAAIEEDLDRKVDLKLAGLLGPLMKQFPSAQRERDVVRGVLFRFGQSAYEPQFVGERFNVEGEPEGDRTEVLWWRKEDLPPRLRDYEDVRDEVVRAWKMDRARTLARQAAEKLVAEIESNRSKWSVTDIERFLREKQSGLGELFELDNVSVLTAPPREVHMPIRTEYTPYSLPSEKAAVMPYPPVDLPQQLLALEKPGEAAVIADGPQRTFYVAGLVARDEPSVKQFRELYSRTPQYDGLYERFMAQRTAEYRRTVTDALRREAGKVKDGRFEIPEDLRRRDGRAEDGGGE